MNGFGFLLIIVALAFLWLALIRPQKRRQQVQARMWETLEPGDEVLTAGGIYGEVTGFDGDDVLVRIAPQLEVKIARRAIAGIVEQGAGEADEAEDSAAADGSYSEESR